MELPYITRVLPPKRLDHTIRRQRLITALNGGLTKKAHILWAPAGYGKTALLADIASELGVPVCWYSFAPEDNDPLVFLRYCLQSIRSVFPAFGTGYRALGKSPPSADWHTQCGFLVSALQSDIHERLVIVFDDLHRTEEKKELQGALSLLIERAPPNCHFILSSRVWPSLSCLPKLAAGGDIISLDVADFRFSTEESIQLLTNLWKRPVSSKEAEKINARTGGWAVGIVLTAKSSSAPALSDIEENGDQTILFGYLSEEVFDTLPYSIQYFLLRTSILHEFTVPFCNKLLGIEISQNIINLIKDRSLFLEERGGLNTAYEYHDLFRDYLHRRFRLGFPDEYVQISRRAASLYREAGDDDSAIYHYLQVDCPDEVVEIIKEVGTPYYDQERWPILAEWLGHLPDHVLRNEPELLLLSGQILIKSGDLTGALERFDWLLTGGHAKDQEVRGRTLVAQSGAYRRLGHLDLAVNVAQDGLAVLLEMDCAPDHVAEAHRQLASALATKGELDLGKHHFQAALEIARKDNLSLLSLICDGLAVACIESGELDQAAVYLERARAGWLKLGSEGSLAVSLTNLALVYYYEGEFDLAYDEVAEALRVAEATGYPLLVATALSRQASIEEALGAFEDSLASASRALEMARALLDQRLVAESTNNLGYAYWKMGETSKAAVLWNQALLEADQSGQKHIMANYHINLGKLYCQEGTYDQALNHLGMAGELLADSNNLKRVAEANIYQAAISYRTGKLKEALEHLAQVARLTSELGHDGFLLADGNDVLDVLRFGAARRVGGEVFSRVVARLTRLPLAYEEPESSMAEKKGLALLPDLRAIGFGAPRVVLDTYEITDVEWRSRKAKELFFYLLCNNRPLCNEEILDALWPEASLGLSDSALKTSIYRLRQAVFYECVLVESGGYRINPAVAINFDVDEFHHHLRLSAGRPHDNYARAEHLQKAIELYDGPFLNGFYSDWCDSYRADLEMKYHTALMNLADYHTRRADFPQSAELLTKVVQSDPYNEEAQYRLIETYIAANEQLVALQHLRTFARICREELGIQLPQRFAECRDRILSRFPRGPATVQ